MCFLEMRFVQRHFFQVYPDEHSLLQVRFAQIGSREQNCCLCALFCRGVFPLFAGEATAQASQRKTMQVYITQVRAAQVQSPAILLAAAPFGIAFVLVCYQQPLDIGTAQLHPFEGIDASLDIRGRR